ncbi:hypothetical protein BRADI_5g14396v3 [Brachypodium distachyon]|uniref:Uncharacterized protein n=1 Tax=Brachypodium distachyon TaxID=15368 RepID=A0A2K2CH61_BRADI|nr:hypothetical protein BRADI_5g14396v3 [Brachypodium distachyon]PNT61373.1 hypothetical protein BRADI_5g14396v3 [Brachypodium distachyon]
MNQEEQIRLWLVETIHENRLVYPPAVNDLTQWGPDFAWPKLTCCIQTKCRINVKDSLISYEEEKEHRFGRCVFAS